MPIETIPGGTYFEVGDSKYVIVPEDGEYEVTLTGTDQGGVTFSLDTLNGETQLATLSVRVATITASTTITIPYKDSSIGNLSVDIDSNGKVDQIISPEGVDVTPPTVSYAVLKSTIDTLGLTKLRKAPLLVLVLAAEGFDKQSSTNAKFVQLETLALNQLELLIKTYQKKGWISQDEATSIIEIINKLR